MVAFSCCEYDEGETEKSEMDAARKRGWGKKFTLKNRVSEPGLNRVNGKCPMTPVEVGFAFKFCDKFEYLYLFLDERVEKMITFK